MFLAGTQQNVSGNAQNGRKQLHYDRYQCDLQCFSDSLAFSFRLKKY
jgi:hypothetical protein